MIDVAPKSQAWMATRTYPRGRLKTVATMIGIPRRSNAGKRGREKSRRRRAGRRGVVDEVLGIGESLCFLIGLLSLYLCMLPIVARLV